MTVVYALSEINALQLAKRNRGRSPGEVVALRALA